MRYIAIMHMVPGTFEGLTDAARAEVNAATGGFDRELMTQGRYVHAEALEGPASARLVRVRKGAASFTDGPYIETKEQMIGFIMFEARDLNEAIATFADHPFATLGAVEIRPTFDAPVPPPLT
jgi:hypothetical protein